MALPTPPTEVRRVNATLGLAPKFHAALDRALERMRSQGFDPIIFETHRTDDRQKFLYGFGRWYDDGRGVVTYSSDASGTWHRYWLAADIISKSKLWKAPTAFWDALRGSAMCEGLRSGDDWDMDGVPVRRDPDEKFSDRPHVQWGRPMRRSPSSRALALVHKGGYEAVWREVGAL